MEEFYQHFAVHEQFMSQIILNAFADESDQARDSY